MDFISRNFGNQQFADGRPLLGFGVETEGSEAGDILIEVGNSSDLMIHHVDRRRSAWVAALMPRRQGGPFSPDFTSKP
jgi:hypothetical protein